MKSDPTLLVSSREAAEILDLTKPYVDMLCDAGKLGPIKVTESGDRCIPRDAVDRYRLLTLTQYDDAPSPRQAGVDAGLYEQGDSRYTNLTRGRDASLRPSEGAEAAVGKKDRL
jgi:excisionase family DNA binding protein